LYTALGGFLATEYFDESEHVDGFAAEERSSDGEEVDETRASEREGCRSSVRSAPITEPLSQGFGPLTPWYFGTLVVLFPSNVGIRKTWAAFISLNRFLGPVDDYVTTN